MKTKDNFSKILFKKIKKLQKQLDANIARYGLFDTRTREISKNVDKVANEYYNSLNIIHYPPTSKTILYFNESYYALKRLTKVKNKFPTTEAWNRFAQENYFLSSVSLEYISNLDWNYLRSKIEREINYEKVMKKEDEYFF